jgi:hypothetical protein
MVSIVSFLTVYSVIPRDNVKANTYVNRYLTLGSSVDTVMYSYSYSARRVCVYCILKGLSHEIDFKNFDKNLQNLT